MSRIPGGCSDNGHIIGNHSASHRSFGSRDLQATIDGIFRYDALNTLLARHGTRNPPSTIDTSDGDIDNRLKARLQAFPDRRVARLLTPHRHAQLHR